MRTCSGKRAGLRCFSNNLASHILWVIRIKVVEKHTKIWMVFKLTGFESSFCYPRFKNDTDNTLCAVWNDYTCRYLNCTTIPLPTDTLKFSKKEYIAYWHSVSVFNLSGPSGQWISSSVRAAQNDVSFDILWFDRCTRQRIVAVFIVGLLPPKLDGFISNLLRDHSPCDSLFIVKTTANDKTSTATVRTAILCVL